MLRSQRIFCIGRNYREHAKELSNPLPTEPMVFMKPVTSLVLNGGKIPFPKHGKELHHEIEIVLQLGENKGIFGLSLGIDFTLRDVQEKLKAQGLPWEKAKAFEGSAAIGEMHSLAGIDLEKIPFCLEVNGEIRQQGNSQEMIFSIPQLIEYLSGIWTLLPGDLIYTGTPAGVGPVHRGDVLIAKSEVLGKAEWYIEN